MKKYTAKSLLKELSDNEEVIFSSSPIPRWEAKEPRRKIIITGPEQLINLLVKMLGEYE